MIPASYLFKDAYSRKWLEPDTTEGKAKRTTRRKLARLFTNVLRGPSAPDVRRGHYASFSR